MRDAGAASEAGARGETDMVVVKIFSINMCLLPAGVNFSGSYLFDGDDRKAERLQKLESMLDDYDIVLLNEMWGSAFEGATSSRCKFLFNASKKGFNVVTDPVGPVPLLSSPAPPSLRGVPRPCLAHLGRRSGQRCGVCKHRSGVAGVNTTMQTRDPKA